MPISKITTDYTGRSKDINIFPSINPLSTVKQKVLPAFGSVSSYCAGIQKLIQRYTISLLTLKGSQSSYPLFGTDLLKQLNVNGLATITDLTHAFNFANQLVVSQFRKSQESIEVTPLDEQLDTAMLLSVKVTANFEVTYKVAIYTKAGVNYDFLLPIPITK